MSNQIFNFNSNPVRIEIFHNQPYFCLLDVCGIFGIQNSRRVQSQMLDSQGVRLAYILAKDEKQRRTAFINEPNLYRIIFRSEKAIAKEFQNWVFEEVLPQIRKTGKYQVEQKQLALPEPEKKFTLELTEYELKKLCWLWKMAELMRGQLYALYEPLRLLGSTHAPSVYGKSREYKSPIETCRKILMRATKDIKTDKIDSNGWNNVIHELRDGKTRTIY